MNKNSNLESNHIESYLKIDKNGETFKLSQLSSGEKSILLLVFELTQEIILINNNVNRAEGIILIDEIELHLHPKWQRNIISALTKTFPNVQFIVTTHSPQIVSSVPNESIFVLQDNQLINNNFYNEGRDTNSILQEAFGLSKRPKEFNDKLIEFYQLLETEDYKSLQKAESILKDLTLKWGTLDTEIVRANLLLQDSFDEIEA